MKVGTPDYLRFCAADESLMSTSRKFLTAPVFVLALLAAAAVAQGTGRWMSGAVMPSERSEVAVAEVREKIYVLGGFRGELELEIYDPSMDRWSRGAAIPRAVHHAAAVGLNGKIYLIGGYVDGWMPSDESTNMTLPATFGVRLPACLPQGARLAQP